SGPGSAPGGTGRHGQHTTNLVGAEAQRRGPAHAGHDGDVVHLRDHGIEADPVDDVAAVEVDHRDAAARLDTGVAQAVVERQAGEGAVARLGACDHGEVVDEGQSAQVTRHEGDRLEAPRGEIDAAEL